MEIKHTHTPADLNLETAATALAALGSETRLGILRCLVRAGPEGLPVGEVQARTGVAASTLSHHIRALVQAGALDQRRDGRTLWCVAQYDRISGLATFLMTECCAEPLVQDEREAVA